ncbi:MAG: CPBP family intramembrane metalloprotease [Paludibacter sp.]|nr:CPBP family intramembrane metalloprotease [Paludibacter sp.]
MNRFKGFLAQSGIISKILLLIGATLFLSIVSILLWKVFNHADMNDISSLKMLQLFQSIGTFVLPPVVLAYFWSENPQRFLHLDTKTNFSVYLFVILFMLIIIPFINLLGALNQQLVLPESLKVVETWMKASEAQATQFTEQLLDVHSIQGLLFNVFLIAILPAIGEELFFRGAVQGIFTQHKNAFVGIWLSAFIFSAIHLQFYGFFPRMLLGAFFGYLLYWSGNLWLPIMAHFTNNVTAVLFYYFKNNGYQVPDIDKIGTESTLWMGCVSAVLCVFGVIFLKRQLFKTN